MYLPVFTKIIDIMQLFPRTLSYLGEIQLFQRQMCRSPERVNAVNFKCNLLTGPLINMIFKGQRTICTERVFQQCTVTKGLVFTRQSL